jgi:hypothetical protein
MSRNVCSIYKYTVGMLYAEGREEKGCKEKKRAFKTTFICLMRINQVKTARKRGRSIKVCIIHYHFGRARAVPT